MPTAHDLSMLDGEELSSRLGESRRELFNLRFQLATGQLDNPSRVKQVKREVARMLTVLRAREILEAEGAYVAPTAAEHEAARRSSRPRTPSARRRQRHARRRPRPRRAWTTGLPGSTTTSTTTITTTWTTTKRMRPDGRRDPRERRGCG